MPINILNSLQKSIKRFRKERVRNAKKMRKTNIVLSALPPSGKVKQLMLTRRQQHKQNIKLGLDLKNSLEKFLKEEGRKEKKTRTSKRRVKRSSRGRGKKTQRRSRTQKNRRRSRAQKNRRRSRAQKNRRRPRTQKNRRAHR